MLPRPKKKSQLPASCARNTPMEHSITLKQLSGQAAAIPRVSIDHVGVEERAASFTKRSIKNESKLDALYTAIRMIDLTTLEGLDTPERVKQMCMKAKHPAPPVLLKELEKHKSYRPIPSAAAVCVYPTLVETAEKALRGSDIHIASVATGFPSGQIPLRLKIEEVKYAVESGADEIDMVISRGDFLRGEYQRVFDEVAAIKDACGEAHLKVILETGELGSLEKVRLASDISMEAGADFIKTSTGKIQPAATMPVTLVMLQAIANYYQKTGFKIGMKPAGGIRSAKQAVHYLVMVNETLGSDWLHPDLFRFGASSLLNDLLKQVYKQITGRYYYEKAFSWD